jgi:hypothetical protein
MAHLKESDARIVLLIWAGFSIYLLLAGYYGVALVFIGCLVAV